METRKAWPIGQKSKGPWIAGLIVLALVLFGPGFFGLLRLSWQQHILDRKLRKLEAVHQELATEQKRLESDPTYVEGLIRSTFKVAKPGELVVPLEPEGSTTAQ